MACSSWSTAGRVFPTAGGARPDYPRRNIFGVDLNNAFQLFNRIIHFVPPSRLKFWGVSPGRKFMDWAKNPGHEDNGNMGGLGRVLMMAGAVLVVLGLLVSFGERLPIRIGRLPGDFVWRGKNSVFYFPLMTSIVVSLLLSLAMWLFNRLR
jgi:Protein of unknown function (DUF2905)